MSITIVQRGKIQNKTLISYAQNFTVLSKEPPHKKISQFFLKSQIKFSVKSSL